MRPPEEIRNQIATDAATRPEGDSAEPTADSYRTLPINV